MLDIYEVAIGVLQELRPALCAMLRTLGN